MSFRPLAVPAMALLGLLAPDAAIAAVFGTKNPAGSAGAVTPLADGRYDVGGTGFVAEGGRLWPDEDLGGTPPGIYELTDGQRSQTVTILDRHRCVSGRDELATVLRLPGSALAGRTICLNPGVYEMTGGDFYNRLQDIPSAAPVTFTSSDPDDRAVLTAWFMAGDQETKNGNVTLLNLDFALTSPEMPLGTDGFQSRLSGVAFGIHAMTENFILDGLRFKGNLREARTGALETKDELTGISGTGHNIVIRNSSFSGVVHAISIAGENILIEHNRARHIWGDFLQLHGQGPAANCRTSRDIVVRNNIVSDVWANFRLHPDVIHLYPPSNMSCGIDGLLVEGMIAYQGEAALQPGRPTNHVNMVPVPAPMHLPERDRQLWRLEPGGESILPPCTRQGVEFSIQRQPGDGALTIWPAIGQSIGFYNETLTSFVLTSDWETWQIVCEQPQDQRWQVRHAVPYLQGIFSNNIPGPDGYRNILIRNNIMWLNGVHGISFRGTGNDRIEVYQNSLLLPVPGDLNGDGLPNQPTDGFIPFFDGQRILLDGPSLVHHNITSKLTDLNEDARAWMNDDGISVANMGLSMARRFSATEPGRFFPQTPREAVEAARPRPDGPLAGRTIGAVAALPEDDWYDWTWVPDE